MSRTGTPDVAAGAAADPNKPPDFDLASLCRPGSARLWFRGAVLILWRSNELFAAPQ